MGRFFYFELRAWIPLITYAAYLLIGRRLGGGVAVAAVGGYLLSAVLLIVGMEAGIQLRDVIGVPLSYESAIEGMVFGFFVVLTLHTRPALAVLSSVLCLSSAGWLYEVSFWNPIQMFINSPRAAAPLAVNTQIISLIILLATLWRVGWRPGKLVVAAFTLYLVSSVYLTFSYPHYYLFIGEIRRWFIRVPTYALLYAVLWETSVKVIGADAEK